MIKGFDIKKYTLEDVETLSNKYNWNEEQYNKIKGLFVPTEWIANNVWLPGTPRVKTMPFDVRRGSELYRDYQYNFLHDNDQFITLRISRQAGKTSILLAELIYLFFNYPGIQIILVTPNKSQIYNLMKTMYNEMIDDSFLEDIKFQKEPYFQLSSHTFASSIKGFLIGNSNKTGTSPIRSHTAQVLAVDEADFLTPEEVAVAEGTLMSYGDRKLIRASSTLSDIEGSWFFNSIDSGIFKDYWVPFPKTPTYTKEEETRLRAMYSYDKYVKEFLVDWSLLSSGLFKPEDLNIACDLSKNVLGSTYKLGDPRVVPLCKKFIIGVDWNTAANGVQILVLGVDKELKIWLVDLKSVTDEEFTQTKATMAVIDMVKYYNPEWVYVDQGYGDMQVEQLQLYSYNHPEYELHLHDRLKGIQFKSKIDVEDPYTHVSSKKQLKAFSITVMQFMIEKQQIYLPDDQWASRFEKGERNEVLKAGEIGIIDEMRSYYVKKYDQYGDPVFDSNRSDHKLSALMFAILAYAIEMYPEYFIKVDQNKMLSRFGLSGASIQGAGFITGTKNVSINDDHDSQFPLVNKNGTMDWEESERRHEDEPLNDPYSRKSRTRHISRNMMSPINQRTLRGRRRLW